MSHSQRTKSSLVSRRRFLLRSTVGAAILNGTGARVAVSAAAALAATVSTTEAAVRETPSVVGALTTLDPAAPRRLNLYSLHTKEELSIVYFTDGMYIDESVKALNYLMRDRRANKTKVMDVNLYDQLLLIQRTFDNDESIHVLSGYRTAETNAKLRKRSMGVAKNSLHMEGRAADFYIPGVPIKKLQKAALALSSGGVGLYSNSNFIHVDTGMVRNWGK
ncbi:MAG: hypothetical protein ACI9UN_001427 [Granulosicoccus sp.]|jgi:uncharacterized protein YcbK (DUF882 family)